MKPAVWSRSIKLKGSLMTTGSGVRADFIFALFMRGFSIAEISAGILDPRDGLPISSLSIEDAIRYGIATGVARRRTANSPSEGTGKR